jgi:sigma-B regulation protein RsbU (phosphoserine phosphatase)
MPAPTTVPEIVIRTPDGSTHTIRLDKERMTLGRSAANELSFTDDHGLSRQHLAFERVGRLWQVHDLGSKNGTLVNGIRITTPTKLEPGDRVSAGHLVISFAEPAPGLTRETVVFVDSSPETPSSSTVITSLEGLLDRENEGAPRSGRPNGELLHAQALAIASRELAVDRPLSELFKVIMDQSLQAVKASRGLVMTAEPTGLEIREARGEGFRISSFVKDRVLNEKHSLLVRDTQLDEAFNKQLSIVENKVRSFMAVPLQTNDKVIGLIYLDSSMVREFTKEDLNLITVMANIAAIRIENARLAEVERQEQITKKELEQAADIQRRLLPKAPPEVAGVDLAGYNAPCRTIGGDYFDFFPYPDGRVAVVVADVAGKGMPAAMLMSSLQARVQVLIEDDTDLASMVTRLNRVVTSNCPSNRFITFFMAVIDPAAGAVTYCNAGHNPPILARAQGGYEFLAGGGMILGILPKAAYQQQTTSIGPGDTLVLYSDGVTEAARPTDGEEYGEERLADFVTGRLGVGAPDLIDAILLDVGAWSAGSPPADDVTLVAARLVG